MKTALAVHDNEQELDDDEQGLDADDDGGRGADRQLLSGYGSADHLEALDDPIEILEVFPHEATDAGVLGDRLVAAAG